MKLEKMLGSEGSTTLTIVNDSRPEDISSGQEDTSTNSREVAKRINEPSSLFATLFKGAQLIRSALYGQVPSFQNRMFAIIVRWIIWVDASRQDIKSSLYAENVEGTISRFAFFGF